jgi:molybdopterin molybdotransferase
MPTRPKLPRLLADDCFRTDSDRLTHAQALSLIHDRIGAVAGVESVTLDTAQGRILAGAVTAGRPIPLHDNAAVDGYAFRHADYHREQGAEFSVVGRAAAGHPFTSAVPACAAVRIFTGAAMPAGLDTVVMQEDVERTGDGPQARILVPAGLKPGANRRLAGEDVKAGELLLEAGHRLRPQDIAAIASTGNGAVSCRQPLRIAILSSGDEIVPPGTALAHGQVYDANGPMLQALAATTGAEAVSLGIQPDRADEVRARLAEAAGRFDLVISSGGASQGEEDHFAGALAALGRRHLWQIAVKPGRPMFFGQIGDCIMLGLPGNPVAVFVCFLLYARPLIARLSGARWREPRRFPVPAGFDFPGKKTGRREFWRGYLEQGPQGLLARKFMRDGSGLISSLRMAEGLIEVGEDVTGVAAGEPVEFIPFSELGLTGL